MKLISCHITGFGKINNFTYHFTDGLQVILEQNGWGKTTFSSFIKAMFYGMEYSKAYKTLSERRHYKPWNGGTYGGNLVFETGGRIYRIERFFGDRDKDDTFRLIDENTGLESSAYSDNIGEELFEVDRASFEKSIFIPQESLETGMTDSLNAKMGDLASAKDDINNFDRALEKVEEAKKNYVRKSKINNGRLSIIKDEIAECQARIDTKAVTLDGFEQLRDKIEAGRKKKDFLEAEHSEIAEQIAMQSKREQKLGAYRQQVEFLEAKRVQMNSLDEFFAAGLPDKAEHDAMQDVERQYDLNRRNAKEMNLGMPPSRLVERWSRLFGETLPDKLQIEGWREQALEIEALSIQGENARLPEDMTAQLGEYRYLFSRKEPTEEELAAVENKVMELTALEGRIAEQDEVYRSRSAKREAESGGRGELASVGVVVLLVVLAVAFMAGGLTFAFMMESGSLSTMLQVFTFGASIGCIVAAFMHALKIRGSHKNRAREMEESISEARETLEEYKVTHERLLEECSEFLSYFRLTPGLSLQQMIYEIRVSLEKYRHLKQEEVKAVERATGAMEKMSDMQMKLYTALGKYAEVYGVDLYHDGAVEMIDKLSQDVNEYRQYLEDIHQLDIYNKGGEKQRKLLESYFERFPVDRNATMAERLGEITANIDRVSKLRAEIDELSEQVESFKRDNEYDDEEQLSVEQLQERQNEVDDSLKGVIAGINQDRESLSELGSRLDDIEEAERRLDNLLEQKLEAERKVSLYEDTAELLKQARENFLAEYMQPLRNGMDRYLRLLDNDYDGMTEDMSYDITMDLDVKITTGGSTRDSEYLSRGYRDLVALCARFALVDVLYEKERPMIILDDPFTNFDREKIDRAMKLLELIAADRQIIYYTCHESRALR